MLEEMEGEGQARSSSSSLCSLSAEIQLSSACYHDRSGCHLTKPETYVQLCDLVQLWTHCSVY